MAAIQALASLDARREPRTSLFVMATLYSELACTPVKVRDVSSTGALLDGKDLPPPGAKVRLCRGSLTIAAKIAWSQGGRAGVQFESTASVAEWLPGVQKAHQRGVDEIVEQLKSSGLGRSVTSGSPAVLSAKLDAVELTQIRIAVESLAEDLAGDAEVVRRHMAKLQALDLAAQALGKLAAER